jgi:hypothetical protein
MHIILQKIAHFKLFKLKYLCNQSFTTKINRATKRHSHRVNHCITRDDIAHNSRLQFPN